MSSPLIPIFIFFIFFITLTLLLPTPTASASPSPSVYDVLLSYNFPIGLLPTGVESYDLDRATGKFSVYLNSDCAFTIQGYQLKYKKTIKGTISRNELKNLSGIQVKILFLWLSIVEVSIDDDELSLSVGIASANFPIDNFYECPQCGCGFECGSKIKGRIVFKDLVSYLFG